jgi:Uma2 family endonuclease
MFPSVSAAGSPTMVDMSVEPVRHLFSVDEYERMGEAGLFAPDARLELLGGEIVEMTPIGSPHAAAVNRLNRLLVLGTGDRAVVTIQNPVRLSDLSEPQPDVSILRARDDFYGGGHARPADVLLVVEVADTTLRWDRGVKRPLYAAAGVPEVWIVDLGSRVVEVATEPGADDYGRVERVGDGGRLSPVLLPDLVIPVADILG